jgi:hypothetical protein
MAADRLSARHLRVLTERVDTLDVVAGLARARRELRRAQELGDPLLIAAWAAEAEALRAAEARLEE